MGVPVVDGTAVPGKAKENRGQAAIVVIRPRYNGLDRTDDILKVGSVGGGNGPSDGPGDYSEGDNRCGVQPLC